MTHKRRGHWPEPRSECDGESNWLGSRGDLGVMAKGTIPVPSGNQTNCFAMPQIYSFISKEKSDWGTLVPRNNVENGIKLGFLLE
jgi:hypothetical protein